jgi:hypothetical protein
MLSYLKELLHGFIGLIIVSFLIWLLIKMHMYFSKNNRSIENILDNPNDNYQFEHKLS